MKRVIKFRAWVEAPDGEKGMHYPKLISFGGGELSWATLQDDSIIKDNGWYEKREVMQFTGLLDKNGKEIYESDRVYIDGGYYFVEWEENRLQWTAKNEGGHSTWLAVQPKHIEVVGNIYENKDLL